MGYTVTIKSSDGTSHQHKCGGVTDQEALIYAGKVVEEKADLSDLNAQVVVERDGKTIGPSARVGEMVGPAA